MEFKEFEPRFKSAKTRFKLSAGLNLETFDTILSGTKSKSHVFNFYFHGVIGKILLESLQSCGPLYFPYY